MRAFLMLSLIVRDKVTRQRLQTTAFEEGGEPKRNRTAVHLLISLTPYRGAKPASRVQGYLLASDITKFTQEFVLL